jgi:hypothetical protein
MPVETIIALIASLTSVVTIGVNWLLFGRPQARVDERLARVQEQATVAATVAAERRTEAEVEEIQGRVERDLWSRVEVELGKRDRRIDLLDAMNNYLITGIGVLIHQIEHDLQQAPRWRPDMERFLVEYDKKHKAG